MGLSTGEQARWWGLGLLLLLAFLWLLGQALLPFLVGAAIAYLLDPVADRLQARGMSRTWATVTITALALLAAAGILMLLVPALIRQIQAFVSTVPAIVQQFQAFLAERFPAALDEGSMLRDSLASAGEAVRAQGLALINGILTSSLAVVDFLLLIIVAPVVAFYLLLDWDHMIAEIDHLLPREHAPVIRHLATEIDRVLAGFVRGQLLVCAIQGAFYAIALALIGLQFGLLIGLFAGLISFIPFVGAILGGVISIGIALFQFWGDWPWIGAVAAVFAIGQAVEGNFLTPKLVGSSVGLHPVWLMFALSAFGALLGFTGLLIAVPAAAAIGVLSRFMVELYRGGRLYRGPLEGESGEG
ncbi:MAG TPA: AI-2E family transporter [Paracoccaceae bacterium]|nr:AI-2E family transporter [Paracoccaceae bacterium]